MAHFSRSCLLSLSLGSLAFQAELEIGSGLGGVPDNLSLKRFKPFPSTLHLLLTGNMKLALSQFSLSLLYQGLTSHVHGTLNPKP